MCMNIILISWPHNTSLIIILPQFAMPHHGHDDQQIAKDRGHNYETDYDGFDQKQGLGHGQI